MIFDTISAISTPNGEGGIGIIRITGNESLEILKKIFSTKNNINSIKTHTINYGFIKDGEKIIDEVLVSIMKSPHTYTKEDIVEINCHGGFLITQKILEIVLKNGARFAEKGEFTKRAFLNGRIDLSQAESVIDIIKGKTEKSLEISLNHLRGDIKKLVNTLKNKLIEVTAHINVVIDYPEEGIEEPLPDKLKENIFEVKNVCSNLIESYEKGKKIRDGIKTTICGKPNVGKSSILNVLLREERAIVTHIPGTTRDVIEEVINIKGIPLVLTDTAGIRESNDFVENIGVNKSKEAIEKASLILFVIDNSSENITEDIEIYNRIKDKNVIGVINKIDLDNKINISKFNKIDKWIKISAKEKNGIDKLEDDLYSYIIREKIDNSNEDIILTNIRQETAIEKTKESLENILKTIDIGMPLDLISIDLKEAIDALSEITGEISSEDILDYVFKNFCVGK